ncbi:MAG: CDP-alcohol phosphatidyltransferase family protein [Myxococcales bacterium]|nr:CDP-alcohol phosphatidyltransferase family protein [Myxococcales bacterium]
MGQASGQPSLPGHGFRARLRRMRNKRYEDWWHIVFGGPIGTLACAMIANVKWITPNGLTWAAFAAKLLGAGLLVVRTRDADLLACVLLQLNIVLDIMDGSLARYRARPSASGAFLDKITDGLGLAFLGTMLGYRATLDGEGIGTLIAGAFIGMSYLARCYMYWVVAWLEAKQEGAVPTVAAPVRGLGELGLRERLGYYLRSTWRIVMVGEGDVYFWIGLFLILGRVHQVVLPLAAAMGFWLVAMFVRRLRTVYAMDRAREREDEDGAS